MDIDFSKKIAIFSDRSSFLVFLYGLVLPLEDFLFQDTLGSVSRIVAILLFVNYILSNRFPTLNYVSKYSIFYSIIILLSLFWSITPDYFGVVRLWILLFSSVIFASIQKKDANTIFKFMLGFLISGCYLSINTILEFFTSGATERVTIEEINNNLLANSLALTALFIIFILINNRLPKMYLPILVLFLLTNIGAIISTGSRGAFTAFLISLVFFLRKGVGKLVFFGLFFALLTIGILNFTQKFDPVIDLLTARIEKTNEDYGGNRIPIWKIGLAMFYDNPITGVGFRNFRLQSLDYAINSNVLSFDEFSYLTINNSDSHPVHNNYLDTLCELGIFGFLFFIIWLIQLYSGILHEKSLDGDIVMILLTYLLISSFFGDLYNLKLFWVLSGISGYYYYSHKNRLLVK